MVKYYCDKCGEEIGKCYYELRYDVEIEKTKLEPFHKMGHLCKSCACELGEMISTFFTKKDK